jgi:hypothetical protein
VGNLVILNLILGLFNLIPAFPMDGGRVLRAVLSGWLGRARATSIAANIGRALAIVFGVYAIFHSPLNLLHVALAAFVYLIAGSEEARVLAEERRRSFDSGAQDQGIWTAPAGYRWVRRGNGVWQLAPIIVTAGSTSRNASSWGS